MHDPATELMRALADAIDMHETFADNFASLASSLDGEGEGAMVEALTRNGRRHRAKVITLRARLGALVEEYGALHVEQHRS